MAEGDRSSTTSVPRVKDLLPQDVEPSPATGIVHSDITYGELNQLSEGVKGCGSLVPHAGTPSAIVARLPKESAPPSRNRHRRETTSSTRGEKLSEMNAQPWIQPRPIVGSVRRQTHRRDSRPQDNLMPDGTYASVGSTPHRVAEASDLL